MNAKEIKQIMKAQADAPMLYFLPPRLKQLLLDDVPGCILSMNTAGNVVFTEPDGVLHELVTMYRDADARKRIMQEQGERECCKAL